MSKNNDFVFKAYEIAQKNFPGITFEPLIKLRDNIEEGDIKEPSKPHERFSFLIVMKPGDDLFQKLTEEYSNKFPNHEIDHMKIDEGTYLNYYKYSYESVPVFESYDEDDDSDYEDDDSDYEDDDSDYSYDEQPHRKVLDPRIHLGGFFKVPNFAFQWKEYEVQMQSYRDRIKSRKENREFNKEAIRKNNDIISRFSRVYPEIWRASCKAVNTGEVDFSSTKEELIKELQNKIDALRG